MKPGEEVSCHYRELAEELEELANWLQGDDVSPEQFRKALLFLERPKLERHGLELSSGTSEGRFVHFALRLAATGELCASMDVDLLTGFIETQHTSV